MSNPKPTVGRIVHYFAYGTPGGEFKPGEARAAIVTAVDEIEETISICVFNPSGMWFNQDVKYGENKPGCWAWPPRV